MKMRKKVAIIFIYLLNNLGDDLFLDHICKRYPDVDFYVMENNIGNKTLSELDNLYFSKEMKTYFKEFDLPELSKKAKRFYNGFDACVVLGGSIFMQFNKDWKGKIANFARRTAINENTYILGANFGPFTDSAFLTEYSKVFSRVKDICFRDSVSASYFPDAKNVRYASDILFSYKHPSRESTDRVAISIINGAWDGRPANQLLRLKASHEAYVDKMVALCSEIARRGFGISLLSFCERQGDLAVAKKIEARCLLNGVTDVKVCSYVGDAQPILDELAGARAVVATRFHAMVLGFVFGKAVYPIVYDSKQRYVLQDLNFFGGRCDYEDVGGADVKEIASAILDEDGCNSYERVSARVEDCKVIAEEHFKALDKILM